MRARALTIFLLSILSICRAAVAGEDVRGLVRVTALRYMMTAHAEFGSERQLYSFYVLRDTEYVKEFTTFSPPVVAFDEARFSSASGQALETKTGKPVKIWSIGGEKIEGSKAIVGISWYSGRLATGFHTVFLEKKDGTWTATSERTDALSRKEPNQ